MKLDKTARTVLGLTALAWSIPFSQAGETREPGVIAPPTVSAAFTKLDSNGDGFLSRQEVAHVRGYGRPFTEADRNGDQRLDPAEAVTAQQLHERALAARYAQDAWITTKVKAALLREDGLDSMRVSVETFDNRVLLSGFVADPTQKRQALLVASRVEGVEEVEDGLKVRY
ncbi:MAG: BON domain-containing protein [Burkholderiales bacterium]